MCATLDECWYTFQHPVGHESRYCSACLRGGQTELVHSPSSFQALTAAAPPGFGATVTSHPGDILKGASQNRDKLWVGRCKGSASSALICLLEDGTKFVLETISDGSR